MIKKIIYLVLISVLSHSTSSMTNVSRNGYFDGDELEDKLICDNKECEVKASMLKQDIKIDISNNLECSDLNIQASNLKGEILLECSDYGEKNSYFYRYDSKLLNWFIDKHVYEKFPVNGPDDMGEYEENYPLESWSIDKKNYKIKNKNTLLSIESYISNFFSKKEYPIIRAVIKSVNISDVDINIKSLTQYNNIAYYLEKAGANEEAVFLLEKILEKFPNRTVAHYNLGDAYWGLGETDKAIASYQTYIQQMKANGKEKRIPQVVLDRVSQK